MIRLPMAPASAETSWDGYEYGGSRGARGSWALKARMRGNDGFIVPKATV